MFLFLSLLKKYLLVIFHLAMLFSIFILREKPYVIELNLLVRNIHVIRTSTLIIFDMNSFMNLFSGNKRPKKIYLSNSHGNGHL